MNELFKLGISDPDIRQMIEMNPEIELLSEQEILSKIQFLLEINCTSSQIRNILITNPFYFNLSSDHIANTIHTLKNLGFTNLNLLYDSNPFFLNYEIEEINEYIVNKQNEGLELSDIVMMIEDNPYLEM